jgi:hypothetical protein
MLLLNVDGFFALACLFIYNNNHSSERSEYIYTAFMDGKGKVRFFSSFVWDREVQRMCMG